MGLQQKRAYFPNNWTKLNSFSVFHTCAQAKIWTFFANLFRPFLSLFLLLRTLSSFFLYGIAAGQVIRKGTNLIFKE